MLTTLLHGEKKNIIARVPSDLAFLEPTRIFAIDIETSGREGRPGDCPGSPHHGICGISICNLKGQAAYCVVDDVRSYGGAKMSELIKYLNDHWFHSRRVAVFHNSKLDLGFLVARGLNVNDVVIRDTWVISSLTSEGIYTSNKLKDIVRTKFNIETDSETVIKEWLEKNDTMDYGDLPVELIGPYACVDVWYTLALSLTQNVGPEVQASHDLIVRNSLSLNRAELRGIRIDAELMSKRVDLAKGELGTYKAEVEKLLGSAEITEPDEEDQVLMRMLHHRSLHPGPRPYFGEEQYVVDYEFLASTKDPLALMFSRYRRYKDFLLCLSGEHGQMRDRIWGDKSCAGVYPSFMLSVFSRGGMPLVKRPNFTDGMKLTRRTREVFIPRDGYELTTLKAMDLNSQLLAYYTQNAVMEDVVGCGGDAICDYLAKVAGTTSEAASLLLRKIIEGSGFKVLERRLKLAGARVGEVYSLGNTFENVLPGYQAMLVNLSRSLRSDNRMRDRCGRFLRVPDNKQYRKHAILISSSFGSLCSMFLDIFVRIADTTGAHLVMAHQDEFVFEVPEGSMDFESGVRAMLERTVIEPQPNWLMQRSAKSWEEIYVNAEDVVYQKWS
jgi:hypothetical protein